MTAYIGKEQIVRMKEEGREAAGILIYCIAHDDNDDDALTTKRAQPIR